MTLKAEQQIEAECEACHVFWTPLSATRVTTSMSTDARRPSFTDASHDRVDSRVKTLLDALHKEVEPRLTVQLDQFLNSVDEKSAEAVTGACLALDGWRTSIKFRRWKGDSDTQRSSSAAKLLPVLSRSLSGSPVSQNPNVATFGIAVFRLLLEELRDSGESVIESVIVCFMLIYGFAGENEGMWLMRPMDNASG